VVAEAVEERVLGSTPRQLAADSAQGTSTVTFALSAAAGELGPASAAIEVRCGATVNNPHFSAGAGGAIYKTDVTCTGTGLASVTVRQRGLLSFAPTDTSPLTKRAESDYPQQVAVNGKATTFYTPQEGSNGGRGNGYWVATSTWQIIAPLVGNVASGQKILKANI
jgi:hypothetical protein